MQDAEKLYNEAIQHNPRSVKAMMGLATLHRFRGDNEQCQSLCNKIILAEPSHEDATIMLSEVMFLGPEPDGASVPLEKLLNEHPNNYHALERLIILLRRAGKLEDVPALLKTASERDRRSGAHAGFRYCSGLYAQFTNDIGKVRPLTYLQQQPFIVVGLGYQ
jgi:tetratricopeptide repeat protein 21B